MKKFKSISLVLVLCILLASCGEEEQHSVTISLDSTPDTDLKWHCEQSENLFEVTMEYTETEKDGNKQGVNKFILTPKKEGLNTVKFYYSRDNEKYHMKEYVYAFIVNEDLSVARGDETGSGPSPLIQ